VPANAPAESTGVPTNEMEGSTGVPVIGESTGVLTEGSTGVHPDEPEENPDPDNCNGGDDNPPPLSARTDNEDDSDDEDDGDGDNNNVTDPNHDAPSGKEAVYHPDSMTPSVQRTHGLRPRKPRDYSHMFSHATVMHHVMTQYSLRKGLKSFKKWEKRPCQRS
jgi:hypothetical protein